MSNFTTFVLKQIEEKIPVRRHSDLIPESELPVLQRGATADVCTLCHNYSKRGGRIKVAKQVHPVLHSRAVHIQGACENVESIL